MPSTFVLICCTGWTGSALGGNEKENMALSAERPNESTPSSPSIEASRSTVVVGEGSVLLGEPSETSVMVMSELDDALRECDMCARSAVVYDTPRCRRDGRPVAAGRDGGKEGAALRMIGLGAARGLAVDAAKLTWAPNSILTADVSVLVAC